MPANPLNTRSPNWYRPPPSSDAVMKIVMTIAKNLATYCSVCSCSWVAACTNAISRPTTAATMIGGADSSSTNHNACCVSWMMSP